MKLNIIKIQLLKIAIVLTIFLELLFSSEINKTFFGNKAVEGYDVVAYFTESKAVKGKKKFTYHYKDANWLFSSKENLELFKKDPQAYEPQYGGYCAWGVAAKSKKYDIEGEQWSIIDGKLYLNYSKSVKEKWEKDIPGFIKQADKSWPKIKNN